MKRFQKKLQVYVTSRFQPAYLEIKLGATDPVCAELKYLPTFNQVLVAVSYLRQPNAAILLIKCFGGYPSIMTPFEFVAGFFFR